MTRKFIPADEAFAKWREDPHYVAAYEELEEEFAIAAAVIKARSQAELTQEQLANKIGSSQTAIARLEGGNQMPSTRTLQRIADATGTKLRISFEPCHAA